MNPHFEKKTINLLPGKRIYFSSDFHLGVPSVASSRDRENRIIQWLEHIRQDAQMIFLVGDVFDFWFEYKTAVPKGFIRFLGKLAELSDAGIEIVLFTGNHDMWMFDYLNTEIGAVIYRDPVSFTIHSENGTKAGFIGHGDGLGPGDTTYKFLKKIFRNRFFQILFSLVHPDIGIWIALKWSKGSRVGNVNKGMEHFRGEEYEWLLHFCRAIESATHHDFYIFGHRHLVLDLQVNMTSRYINLGEWVTQQYYAVFDGENIDLKNFISR